MSGKLRYAYLDESPVVFNDTKAHEYVGGQWKPLHLADAMCKARLLTKAEFASYAAGVPAAPIT
jgi:hypothetical protein